MTGFGQPEARVWWEIEGKLSEWGADLSGVGDLTGLVPERYQAFTRGISFAVKLADAVLAELVSGPTPTYFHHYDTVNRFLDQIALKLVRELERRGALAFPIPSSQTVDETNLRGLFQHKIAATRAGLGWIGRNGLLITPEYGPRVRFATVLTDIALPVDEPITKSRCKGCRACVEACPAGALKGELWEVGRPREELVDAERCHTWILQNYKELTGGTVCGICIQACPWGKKQVPVT